jgi:hypothetical protein
MPVAPIAAEILTGSGFEEVAAKIDAFDFEPVAA